MSGPMCKENYVFNVKYISSHYGNDNYIAGIKSMYVNNIHISCFLLDLLYRNADSVTDELFRTLDFFDPLDLIQVKYEMVRRVQKENWSVTRSAAAFGFSRISYYAIQHAFETEGILGLMPKKRGPKQPIKLTDAVMQFIERQREQEPVPSAGELQSLVGAHLGVTVHKRTIERALQGKKKPSSTDGE